jgi:cell wall-associated NlpC family hydrolase
MGQGSNISGTAVAVSLVGAVLAYSGIKGSKITDTIRTLIASGPSKTGPQISGTQYAPSTMGGGGRMGQNFSNIGGSTNGAIVVSAAESQLGKPYVWNTPSNFNELNPTSFDCSGLTGWCYAKIGVKLGHFTGTQLAEMSHRSVNNAQPGDLIFFAVGRIGIPYHVAIYTGNGGIIEAPQAGVPVQRRQISATDKDVMPLVGACP